METTLQPGQQVRVYGWSLSALPQAEDAQPGGLVKFQSWNAATQTGTDLTGWRALTRLGLSWDMRRPARRLTRPDAYFETRPGEGLALVQSEAFDVGGFVCAEQVAA